jgi:hypothetical protein
MTIALEPPSSEYLALLLDDDFVRAEFEEIVAAEWGEAQELPAPPARKGGAVGVSMFGPGAQKRSWDNVRRVHSAVLRTTQSGRQRSPPANGRKENHINSGATPIAAAIGVPL